MKKGRLSSRTFQLGKCTIEKEERDHKCYKEGKLGTVVHYFLQKQLWAPKDITRQ